MTQNVTTHVIRTYIVTYHYEMYGATWLCTNHCVKRKCIILFIYHKMVMSVLFFFKMMIH